MKLTDFKVLTFDCYGTLIDWESGIVEALKPLTSKITPQLSRDQILEAHARHESEQQLWTPGMCYSTLLSIVYRRLAEQWGLRVSHNQCLDYGESVRQWPAFKDSKASLQYLKQHYKLVILSNVDNLNFEGSNEQLGVEFDAIYTAEDIGSYKPSDKNFDYMLAKIKSLGLGNNDILHTAESMFHDHVPARRQGLANCWIYRRHAQDGFGATMDPGTLASVDFQFNSMAELVKAHKQASENKNIS